MRTDVHHDNLRDNIGQAIADKLVEMTDGGKEMFDVFDSRNIDVIADAVVAMLPAGGADALPDWTDPRVQAVYGILCSQERPPSGEQHWEGWIARRIVAHLVKSSPAGDAGSLAGLSGDGPHEPSLLMTDAAMLAQARALREFLIDRAEAEGDTSAGHSAACYTLRSAVQGLIHGYEQMLEYHRAQDGLIEKAQREAERLRDELAEVKRPLDAQMARLNQRVIALTAENDRLAALASRAGQADTGSTSK